MNAKEMRARLLEFTQQNCESFNRSGILDMSRLGECPRKLAWEMMNHRSMSDDLKMRLYKVVQMETELIARLTTILGKSFSAPKVITALDKWVVGITSGQCDSTVIKIKSVPEDEALPNGRAPNNHYWATQGLMHFGHFKNCILIYESRTSGRIQTYDHIYSPQIGLQCQQKAEQIIRAVNAKRLPECQCGRCETKGFK